MEGQPVKSSSWLSSWWLERAMVAIRPFARGVLLDVGCGPAPYRGFFDVERHVTCDWPGTLHARGAIDVYASAESLPFASDSFDTVLCTEVLEHVPQPGAAIAEAARVLRPGGHLIASVPFLYGIHEEPRDFFRYTEYGLRALLAASRLEPVQLLRRGGSVSVLTDVSMKLVSRVAKRGLGALSIPRRVRGYIVDPAIELPQRAVALAATLADRRLPRVSALIGASTTTTLGYVIVAQRGTN